MLNHSSAMFASRYIASPMVRRRHPALAKTVRKDTLAASEAGALPEPCEPFATCTFTCGVTDELPETVVRLASIEVYYKYKAAADLASLFDQALTDPSVTHDDLHDGASTLRSCVLQRLRDGGTRTAKAAVVACSTSAPYSLQVGPVSISVPASAPRAGVVKHVS